MDNKITNKKWTTVFFSLLIVVLFMVGCSDSPSISPYSSSSYKSEPKETKPEYQPTEPEPQPVDIDPQPVEPEVHPIDPEPQPIDPEPVEPIQPINDGELQIGDVVRIQNVNTIMENGKSHGLHIRGKPKLQDKFIRGHVFDGAVGIIQHGPIHDGTYVWWLITWKRNSPLVKWLPEYKNLCDDTVCSVWSVQYLNNGQKTVLIKK